MRLSCVKLPSSHSEVFAILDLLFPKLGFSEATAKLVTSKAGLEQVVLTCIVRDATMVILKVTLSKEAGVLSELYAGCVLSATGLAVFNGNGHFSLGLTSQRCVKVPTARCLWPTTLTWLFFRTVPPMESRPRATRLAQLRWVKWRAKLRRSLWTTLPDSAHASAASL